MSTCNLKESNLGGSPHVSISSTCSSTVSAVHQLVVDDEQQQETQQDQHDHDEQDNEYHGASQRLKNTTMALITIPSLTNKKVQCNVVLGEPSVVGKKCHEAAVSGAVITTSTTRTAATHTTSSKEKVTTVVTDNHCTEEDSATVSCTTKPARPDTGRTDTGRTAAAHSHVWSQPLGSSFAIRGPLYFKHRKKIPSQENLFPTRGVDMFLTKDFGYSHVARYVRVRSPRRLVLVTSSSRRGSLLLLL